MLSARPPTPRPLGRAGSHLSPTLRSAVTHAARHPDDDRLAPSDQAEASASAAVRRALAGLPSPSASARALAVGEAACLVGAAILQVLPHAQWAVEGGERAGGGGGGQGRVSRLVAPIRGRLAVPGPPPPSASPSLDPAALALLTLGGALSVLGRGVWRIFGGGEASNAAVAASASPAALAARVGRLEAVAARTAAAAAAAASAADKARLRSRLLARDVGPALRAAQAEAAAASEAAAALGREVGAARQDAADGRALLVGLEALLAKQWGIVSRLVAEGERREAATRAVAPRPARAVEAAAAAGEGGKKTRLAFRRGGGSGDGPAAAVPPPPPPPPPPPAAPAATLTPGAAVAGGDGDDAEVLFRF